MEHLIVGRQPVLEALRSDTPLEKICILHGTHGTALQQIEQLARRRGVAVTHIDKQRFAELTKAAHAQGVLALLGSKQYTDLDGLLLLGQEKKEPPFLLILDEIEDPHNLGALIRTAECAGVHGIILPRHHSAPLTETVVKASAGASLHMPVAKVTNVASTIEELRTKGIWIVGTEADAPRLYSEHDYSGGIAIVIGNEGKGMRRLVKEKCDFLVRIPLYGKISSLNASVAGGLILFEAARHRHGSSKES